VVLVTHKMHEVKRYADAVTIMRAGKTVARSDPRTAPGRGDRPPPPQLTVGKTASLP